MRTDGLSIGRFGAPPRGGDGRDAALAGLRYVRDGDRGIRRIGSGRAFRYVDEGGRAVRGSAVVDRIRALAIPPAWRDVWICPTANGHLQASGRDARGRKQYRYHAAWVARRSDTKFERMVEFGEALAGIRAQVARDVASPALSCRKVAAVIVRLLERSLIRVGCAEYARTNDAYGLATLCDQHVRIDGAELRFQFRGKGGKRHRVIVNDRSLARIVKRCMDLPGRHLFQYLDEANEQRCIDSGDVNDYLREIAGADFTAKDFRTWGATLLAAQELGVRERPASDAARRRVLGDVLSIVSDRLGNTPGVCRKSYVCPEVVELWEAGRLPAVPRATRTRTGLDRGERALIALLRRAQARRKRAA